MAYNNGFPVSYQQMYPMYQPQMQQQVPQVQTPQPQTQNSPMVWVQGETGAKSYLLAPNTTLPLWDSESQTIYLKSSDASGMPSMKILDYTIREQTTNQSTPPGAVGPSSDFVTHKELSDFREEIAHKIDSIQPRRTDNRKKDREEVTE